MPEKTNKNFTIFILLIILFIVVIALAVVVSYYTINMRNNALKNNNKIEEKVKEDEEILTLVEKTSYYSEDGREYRKFIIKDKDDLSIFRLIHPLSPAIDDKLLKDRTLFVLIQEESSGSINNKLLNATIKNGKISFNIVRDEPEVGTADMAMWYFVASVPNSKLEGLDLREWFKPKEVQQKLGLDAHSEV